MTFSLTFNAVEASIKSHSKPQQDDLLDCYIFLGIQRAREMQNKSDVKRAYLRMISVLEEAMCESLSSVAYRLSCYRAIKKMMPLIFELLDTRAYQHKVTELKLLRAYFLPDKSENHKINSQLKGNI